MASILMKSMSAKNIAENVDKMNNTLNEIVIQNNTPEQINKVIVDEISNEIQKQIPSSVTTLLNAAQSNLSTEDKIKTVSKTLLNDKQNKIVNGVLDQLQAVKDLEKRQLDAYTEQQKQQSFSLVSTSGSNPDENKEDEIGINTADGKPRDRKIDRKNLHADLAQELPISIRYNYNGVNDHDKPFNYEGDWMKWSKQAELEGCKLQILRQKIIDATVEYEKLSGLNGKLSKGVQFSLLLLGSSIVYVQASGADMTLIRDWNIVGGGMTTLLTTIYNYWQFGKKSMHYGKVVTNLKLLRGWLESKLVLPFDQRFSPYDIFMIGSKAYDAIIQDAEEGTRQTTTAS
jgi:hypothetical protein